MRRHEIIDLAVKSSQLFNPARRKISELRTGHHKHRLYVWGLHPVEVAHLHLVLKVRDLSKAFDDNLRAHSVGKENKQLIKGLNPNVV